MPPIHRTRVFHLTRDIPFLVKCAAGIALGGLVIAGMLVHFLEPSVDSYIARFRQVSSPAAEQIVDQLETLKMIQERQGKPPPKSARELADWLHLVMETSGLNDPERRHAVIGECKQWIDTSEASPSAKELLHAYLTARLGDDAQATANAAATIKAATLQKPAEPLAHELMGYLLLLGDEEDAALQAFQAEGVLPDATGARQEVLEIAIEREDKVLLQQLLKEPLYRDSLRLEDRSEVGSITGDLWLQWTGILGDQWATASVYGILLGLLSGLMWYVVLVRSGERTPWRWWWPALPVLAGIASIWPTLLILNYQERELGMAESDQFPADIYYEVMGVGAREEVSKLLLFSLMLPWLLKRRSAGLAALTGGFVGLGFSLEENVRYISMGADTWGRVLTASFLHVGLTGMTGHAAYQMLRSRFHEALPFVITLVAAVVAHGIYNWAPTAAQTIRFGQDLDLISLILLGGLAHQYYSLLSDTLKPQDGVVSTASVFILCSALLVAVGFIAVALGTDDWQLVTMFGNTALGYVPIAIFHVRKLGMR